MTLRHAIAVAAFLLAACAGTPFEWEDTAKIQPGMTEAQVVAILGKPHSRSQYGNTTVLTWAYSQIGAPAKAVTYRFVDGRLASTATRGK